MAFESLTDRLAGVFKKLRGHGKLTEADIKTAMREVRMACLLYTSPSPRDLSTSRMPSSA